MPGAGLTEYGTHFYKGSSVRWFCDPGITPAKNQAGKLVGYRPATKYRGYVCPDQTVG